MPRFYNDEAAIMNAGNLEATYGAGWHVDPTPWISHLKPYCGVNQDSWTQKSAEASLLKLNSNEGVDPPECVIARVIEFLQRPNAVSRYAAGSCVALRQLLAETYACDPEMVGVYCGADGALDAVTRAFLSPGDTALLVQPGYDQVRAYVQLCGARPVFIRPSSSVLEFDGASFLSRSRQNPTPKLVYLINPNNPAGYLISEGDIARIAAAFQNSVVIIDETYGEFAEGMISAVSLVGEFSNLLVIRSFSKAYGLAGLRLGYLIAPPEALAILNNARNEKAVTMMAQMAGLAVLQNKQLMDSKISEIIATRKWFVSALRALGITAHDTNANFILIETQDPKGLVQFLKRRRILIRNLDWISGLEKFVRISVGRRSDMTYVIKVLEAIVSDHSQTLTE